MRVVVSSTGMVDGKTEVSPIFGRCASFVLVDTADGSQTVVANPAVGASGGAGVQSAQFVAQQGVEAVISGNVGPNAMRVLVAAGLPVYAAAGGLVQDAVAALVAGELSLLEGPSVGSDFGKPGMGGRRGARG